MLDSLAGLRAEHASLQEQLSDSAIHTNPALAKKLNRRYAELSAIMGAESNLIKLTDDLAAAKELAKEDEAFAEELPVLEQQLKDAGEKLRRLLIPRDPDDGRDVIMEIKAGEGGAESALFAADLLRMYLQYANSKGWKTEILDKNESDLGGIKDIQLAIKSNTTDPAQGVHAHLKYEGGVHRVQRVPETESQGRIHTSAAGVLVLPEAEEVDVKINDADLRIDVFRSSGPGGQSVNTTDSAVRVTHIPSGIVVSQQDEKSQHKNKAKALKILRSKLYDLQRSEQESERAKARKSQIGTGDRSERIRTYNFPQGRVTDHRINMTLYKLTDFLAGDAFKELSDAIQIQFQETDSSCRN